MVGVPVDTSSAVLVGFFIPWRAVDADVKNPASSEGWEGMLDDRGFGNSLHRALGLGVWILLQDGVEGCFGTSDDL